MQYIKHIVKMSWFSYWVVHRQMFMPWVFFCENINCFKYLCAYLQVWELCICIPYLINIWTWNGILLDSHHYACVSPHSFPVWRVGRICERRFCILLRMPQPLQTRCTRQCHVSSADTQREVASKSSLSTGTKTTTTKPCSETMATTVTASLSPLTTTPRVSVQIYHISLNVLLNQIYFSSSFHNKKRNGRNGL